MQTELERQESVYSEYRDLNNVKSPNYYILRAGNALRGDDNWAGRDRKINGNRQNTPVRDDTYKQFVDVKPSKAKSDLIIDYKNKLDELEAAKNGTSTINIRVPQIPEQYRKYDDELVRQLLATIIERPELSEREMKLLALVQSGKSDDLSRRLQLFKLNETKECPYCFQTVNQEYKESLVESIEKVLSKDVEDHNKALKLNVIEQFNIDLKPYEKLEGYQRCYELLTKMNDSIQECNENLKKKIDNPYEPIYTVATTIKELACKLSIALEKLEDVRLEYNRASKKTAHIISELKAINSELAHYDIADIVMQLHEQEKKSAEEKKLLDKLKETYTARKKEVEDLEAQRKNVQIAIDAINSCMKYIFFAENRLEIEYVNGNYKLLSHGKSVKPCEVSVGERNIIGLSYFFTSILEGQEERNAYSNEYLIVIDDPISSYDMENRIGILSFLKYKLSTFLTQNMNTKVLIMTHDIITFYDIHKVFEEIIEECKQKEHTHSPKFNRFELRNGILMPFRYTKRQEYTEIINVIYKYANGEASDYEMIIGNMMRQVLEAFATFEYRKGIEDVSTDTNILELLQAPEYISYYKNLMYRLVLHGGSHKEEQIKAMNDLQFFSVISNEEKKRTARDILCFIYLLNKRHLLEHLKEIENVEIELVRWCQEIKERAAII